MPSTYTLNNGIELIGTGEQSGTWGSTTNTNLELLDTALDGQVAVTLSATGSSGSPNALPISDGSNSNGRNRLITFNDGSDLGGTAYVQLTPNDAEKIIYVRNSLSGSRSIALFQGTYNASNDYEVPAGTTAVVFFNGAGTGAVAANVFNNAHFDALNVVGSVTVGGGVTVTGTVDAGAVEFDNLSGTGAVSVTNILDEDNMASNSATALSTQQSIKAYVDSQVGTVDTLAEILANGNTTGGTDLAVSTGDDITFADSSKAIFGAGSDLQIYHDGSASRIQEQGTGNLVIRASSGTYIQGVNGENGLAVIEDGTTTAYHDGVARLATTGAGVNITGGFTATAVSTITHSGNGKQLELVSTDTDGSSGPQLDLYRNSSSPANDDYTGRIKFISRNNNSQDFTAADFLTRTIDVSDGSEDATLFIQTMTGGTVYNRLNITPTEVVLNEESRDLDFRVESDSNANAIFMNAGNGTTAFGTTTDNYNHASNEGIYLSPGSSSSFTANSAPIRINRNGTGGNDRSNLEFYNNGAIRGWIGSLGAEDGIFLYANGSNGIHLYSDEVVVNENSSNHDFRVESDGNTHALFVDAGNNRTHIGGTTVPPSGTYSAVVQGTLGVAVSDSPANPNSTSILDSARFSVGGNGGNYLTMGTYDNDTAIGTSWIQSSYYVPSTAVYDLALNPLGGNVSVGDQPNPTAKLVVSEDNGGAIDLLQLRNSNSTYSQSFDFNLDTGKNMVVTGASGNGGYRFNGGTNGFVINETSNDMDFRVESDSKTHALYVDAGNNCVGIKSTNPAGYNSSARDLVIGDGGGNYGMTIATSSTTNGSIFFADGGGTDAYRGFIQYRHGVDDLVLGAVTQTMVNLADAEVVINDNSYNRDFRVESDSNANMLFVDAGGNKVGVGTGTIQATMHVYSGDSGASVNSNANDLFVESSADAGITIGSGNTSSGSLRFADNGGNGRGIVFYDHSNDNLVLYSGGSERVRLSSTNTVFNEDSGDTDFRVESNNNANMLFVDGGNDLVMVGSSTPSSPGQQGLKVGDGWTYNSYYFSFGGSRTLTFSGQYNYQIEVTVMITPNTGNIGQSRFIAGRRDWSGSAHIHATADIVNNTSDIAVSTSDSGQTRSYTLTFTHGTDSANVEYVIEVKSRNSGTITVS